MKHSILLINPIILIMKTSNESLLSRNIATIAVFYALPVIQLVITYQTVR